MEKVPFIIQLTGSLSFISVCLILHYGIKNFKHIWVKDLNQYPFWHKKVDETNEFFQFYIEQEDIIDRWCNDYDDKRSFEQLYNDYKKGVIHA